MTISLPVPLLVVVVVLIVGIALLRLTRKTHHLQKRRFKKQYIMRKRLDYGAHIARQHGHERSPEWPRVAKEHRLREPACVVCGYKGKKLQVHHIKPFHLHPQLELDPHNLITLCEARGRDHPSYLVILTPGTLVMNTSATMLGISTAKPLHKSEPT